MHSTFKLAFGLVAAFSANWGTTDAQEGKYADRPLLTFGGHTASQYVNLIAKGEEVDATMKWLHLGRDVQREMIAKKLIAVINQNKDKTANAKIIQRAFAALYQIAPLAKEEEPAILRLYTTAPRNSNGPQIRERVLHSLYIMGASKESCEQLARMYMASLDSSSRDAQLIESVFASSIPNSLGAFESILKAQMKQGASASAQWRLLGIIARSNASALNEPILQITSQLLVDKSRRSAGLSILSEKGPAILPLIDQVLALDGVTYIDKFKLIGEIGPAALPKIEQYQNLMDDSDTKTRQAAIDMFVKVAPDLVTEENWKLAWVTRIGHTRNEYLKIPTAELQEKAWLTAYGAYLHAYDPGAVLVRSTQHTLPLLIAGPLKVRKLTIESQITDEGLTQLAKLMDIETLEFNNFTSYLVSSDGLAQLAQLPNLQSLKVVTDYLDDEAIDGICRIKQLKRLQFELPPRNGGIDKSFYEVAKKTIRAKRPDLMRRTSGGVFDE